MQGRPSPSWRHPAHRPLLTLPLARLDPCSLAALRFSSLSPPFPLLFSPLHRSPDSTLRTEARG
eukprot:6460070-Pyramimonas_sp.AAC.1